MKKRIYLVLIFTTFFISIVFAQKKSKAENEVNYLPYYQEATKANKLVKEEQYAQAFLIYDELYKEFDPIIGLSAQDYINYIKSAELSNSCYSRFKVMKTLISKLGFSNAWIDDFEILKTVYEKSGIDKKVYDVLRNEYVSSINLGLRNMVIQINKRDQESGRSYETDIMKKSLEERDSINFTKLKYIFEKYGYPNASVIGNESLNKKRERLILSSVLRHVNDSLMVSYLLPKLKSFVVKGEFLPQLYLSIYESYTYRNKLVSEYRVSSKYTKEEVNKNRYSVGLPILD